MEKMMKSKESISRRRPGALTARGLAVGALLLMALSVAQAEEKKRCLVIHVTQADPKVWVQALNMTSNVPKALGMDNVTVELVAQGPGLGILKSDSPHKERVNSLAQYGSTFSACGNTMKAMERKSGKEVTILEGARVVPAGVIRVMELQEQGCSYVRP
jgi:intracellular sulfur oxidation DsrE/DsrF family protein